MASNNVPLLLLLKTKLCDPSLSGANVTEAFCFQNCFGIISVGKLKQVAVASSDSMLCIKNLLTN